MEKDLTLVIMAAGMGSRFGGLKQIEPVGPGGEFIIDYSIYDAIQSGFTKIVFIIKKENYEIFKDTVGKRIESHIKVEYVFQEMEDLPEGYTLPKDRVRPWGTSHAILSARNVVDGNFGVINSDDFYGKESFVVLANHLIGARDGEFGLVGYECANTLAKSGAVKRGVCDIENGSLLKIVESKCEIVNGKIVATPLSGDESFEVSRNQLVSMNMFGFTLKLFKYLELKFPEFLEKNKDNIQECEYLIPQSIYEGIVEKEWSVNVLPTTAKWYGITYKEDKEGVVEAIEQMISKGEYPKELWN